MGSVLGREDRTDRLNMRTDRHLGSEERGRFRRKGEDDLDSAAEADLHFVVDDVLHVDRVVLYHQAYTSRRVLTSKNQIWDHLTKNQAFIDNISADLGFSTRTGRP